MAGGDLEALGCAVLDASGLDVPFDKTGSLHCLSWGAQGSLIIGVLLRATVAWMRASCHVIERRFLGFEIVAQRFHHTGLEPES